jgi:hypothetical protein
MAYVGKGFKGTWQCHGDGSVAAYALVQREGMLAIEIGQCHATPSCMNMSTGVCMAQLTWSDVDTTAAGAAGAAGSVELTVSLLAVRFCNTQQLPLLRHLPPFACQEVGAHRAPWQHLAGGRDTGRRNARMGLHRIHLCYDQPRADLSAGREGVARPFFFDTRAFCTLALLGRVI